MAHAGPSEGWLHKIFGKTSKGKASKKAMHKGGMLDKMKKKKGNPY